MDAVAKDQQRREIAPVYVSASALQVKALRNSQNVLPASCVSSSVADRTYKQSQEKSRNACFASLKFNRQAHPLGCG